MTGLGVTRRSRRSLIAGSSPAVAIGLAVSGLAAYVYLIVTARRLGPVADAPLSALWTLAFLVGPGVFVAVEQELTRSLAARRAHRIGIRPALQRAAQVGGVLVAALLVLFGVLAPSLMRYAFDHQVLLLISLALAFTGYYVMHLVWGLLAGTGKFRAYGVVTGTEAVARAVIAVALLFLGVRSVGMYGLAIGVAPFFAALAGVWYGRVPLGAGPDEPLGRTATAVGYLVVGSFVAQFVMMIGPLVVKVLAHPGQQAEASRFLAALTLTRVPLFLINAVLIALLPRLTGHVHEGRAAEFRQTVGSLVSGLVALFVLGTVAAALLGPWLVRSLFGDGYALSGGNLALLEAACGIYILAMVLTYALIALSRQLWATLARLVGCLVFFVVTFAGAALGLLGRVEWALFAGSGVSALCAVGLLAVAQRRQAWAVQPRLGPAARATAGVSP